MDVLMALIFLLGMIGCITSIVMIIVSLIKKQSIKRAGVGILLSCIILVFSAMMMPDETIKNGVVGNPQNPIKFPEYSPEQIGLKWELEDYDNERFSIRKPDDWDIYRIGDCTALGFIMKDRKNPARQVLYFGSVGPVYLNESAKWRDRNSFGWNNEDIPVISDVSPENFLKSFGIIANCNNISMNFPQFPALSNVQAISIQDEDNIIIGDMGNVQTQLIRAVFEQDGEVLEGVFLIETVRMEEAGYGFAYPAIGVIAPVEEYVYVCDFLMESLGTFRFNEQYVQQCIESLRASGNEADANAFDRISKTIDETNEMVYDGWKNRQPSGDISAKQYTDMQYGNVRFYDKDSPDGETFYGTYQEAEEYMNNSDRTNKPNLVPLTREQPLELWNSHAKPLGGNVNIE